MNAYACVFRFSVSPPFRQGSVFPYLLIFLYFGVSLYRDVCPCVCLSPCVYHPCVCDLSPDVFDVSQTPLPRYRSSFSSPKFLHEFPH